MVRRHPLRTRKEFYMVQEAMDFLTAYDPEVGKAIQAEYDRQQQNIELIA